jgi:hypothetical protein
MKSIADSDGDGINFQEDLNNDGYIYNYSNKVNTQRFLQIIFVMR